MMDSQLVSSMIDAGLTFAGVAAVVLMGSEMLSSESTTVSASLDQTGSQAVRPEYPTLRKAA